MKRLLQIALGISLTAIVLIAGYFCISKWRDPIPSELESAVVHADQFTAYAYVLEKDPWDPHLRYKKLLPKGRPFIVAKFRGYPVSKEVVISSQRERNAILQNLRALAFRRKKPNFCSFFPTRFIRLNANGHTYDWLICFGCGEVKIYKDDQPNLFADFDLHIERNASPKMKTHLSALLKELPEPTDEPIKTYFAPPPKGFIQSMSTVR